MKKIKGVTTVLAGFRGGHSSQNKSDLEVEETLKSEHFNIAKLVRHGFPYMPSCIAFDPVQHLLAIGTKEGSIRIFGRPGVDCHVRHDGNVVVLQLIFLVNDGALISLCSDNRVNLWTLRQKTPQIVHSLQFKREQITYGHVAFQTRWLYLGTDRGTVHIVHVESFTMSGYMINWNKAIEISRRTHPGKIVHLSECPSDSNKLLIGFESGAVVLWDLQKRVADSRFNPTEALHSISWHFEGKHFVCSHLDGSLSKWAIRTPNKALEVLYLHSTLQAGSEVQLYRPISKVAWLSVKNGDDVMIFSGGTPTSKREASISVQRGKNIDILVMEHSVVDFVPLCESPYANEAAEPYAVAVLLQSDLVVIDLLSEGCPNFENPYPMDLHESAVTSCLYLADCPADMVPTYYSMGAKRKRTKGFSNREWPVRGGEWGNPATSYPEIVITGHADGSLKFWDASSMTLQVLYKVKTSRFFQKNNAANAQDGGADSLSDSANHGSLSDNSHSTTTEDIDVSDRFAINLLDLCGDSRRLVVAGTGYVILLQFNRREIQSEIVVIDVNLNYSLSDELDGPEDVVATSSSSTCRTNQRESVSSSCSNNDREPCYCVNVRQGSRRWPPGYQPEFVCRLGFTESDTNHVTQPPTITSLRYSSSYQLLALGTDHGLVILDTVQNSCLLNMGTPDLYGSMDPYNRVTRKTAAADSVDSHARSPTAEQPEVSFFKNVGRRGSSSGRMLPPPAQISNANGSSRQRKFSVPVGFMTSAPSRSSLSFEHVHVHMEEEENEVVEEEEEDEAAPGMESCEIMTEEFDFNKNVNNSATVGKTREKAVHKKNLLERLHLRRASTNFVDTTNMVDSTAATAEVAAGSSGGGSGTARKEKRVSIVKRLRDAVTRPSLDHGVALLDLTEDNERFYEQYSLNELRVQLRRLATIRTQDRVDSVFTRSISSSSSSLENVSREGILTLVFADSYPHKSDHIVLPSLWVGTSLGSIMVINIKIPEQRASQPVMVSPSGTIFRLKGAILCIGFLDSYGDLLAAPLQRKEFSNKPMSLDEQERKSRTPNHRGDQAMSSAGAFLSKGYSVSCSNDLIDKHLVLLCSERQARVLALPSQVSISKMSITETSCVIRADVTILNNATCLCSYLANGHIIIVSLPSLKPLLDVDFLPMVDYRIAKTFQFSHHGHALYFCSPCELQKLTYSATMCDNLNDMLGDLFLPCDTPEPPKKSLLATLSFNFGIGATPELDREQLFGETSGKAPMGTVSRVSNMDRMQSKAQQSRSEIGQAMQKVMERGEKLESLADETEKMKNSAEMFGKNAAALQEKFKKQSKWF